MPRYYCDYCDTYLTHDSQAGRKQHNRGWKHRENVKLYYEQFLAGQGNAMTPGEWLKGPLSGSNNASRVSSIPSHYGPPPVMRNYKDGPPMMGMPMGGPPPRGIMQMTGTPTQTPGIGGPPGPGPMMRPPLFRGPPPRGPPPMAMHGMVVPPPRPSIYGPQT